MIDLDGTENKCKWDPTSFSPCSPDSLPQLLSAAPSPPAAKFGANAILGVSLAVCKAGAAEKGVPLYRHIADLAGNTELILPVPVSHCREWDGKGKRKVWSPPLVGEGGLRRAGCGGACLPASAVSPFLPQGSHLQEGLGPHRGPSIDSQSDGLGHGEAPQEGLCSPTLVGGGVLP